MLSTVSTRAFLQRTTAARGLMQAHARHLSDFNRRLLDELSAIPPHSPAAFKAQALSRLEQAHGAAASQHWRGLSDQLSRRLDPQEAQALERDRRVCAALIDILSDGPARLRHFPPPHDAPPGPAEQDLLAQLAAESGSVVRSMLADPAGRQQALTYAALIDPDDHEELVGVRLSPRDAQEVARMREEARTDRGLLSRATVLQLRDYAHHSTGAFRLYGALDKLVRDGVYRDVLQIFDDVLASFREGVDGMWSLPAARYSGEVHKGWLPTQAVALEPGQPFGLRRPMSGTSRVEQCYGLRRAPSGEAYDCVLRFGGTLAHPLNSVRFALFNERRTVHEGEVLLLPGQQFLVDSQQQIRKGDPESGAFLPLTQYVLRKVSQDHEPAG